MCLIDGLGRNILIPAHVIAAKAECDLGEESDLVVLYVGLGIGRKKARLAIDRLISHSKLQRILAETLCNSPHFEILLLLYRNCML